MQLKQPNQEQLTLQWQASFALTLCWSISFFLAGLFLGLLGLLLWQEENINTWIMSELMGIMMIVMGIFWLFKYPGFTAFTFDKGSNLLLWERGDFLHQGAKQSLELPLDLIVGVEVVSDSFADTTLYYPQLILEVVYWRIPLASDQDKQKVMKLSKNLADFLRISYFPDQSKAPEPIWRKKLLTRAAPYQFYWQFLEQEIESLQKQINDYPNDAETYLELGVLLRSKPQTAISYLQEAERLFLEQQEEQRARSVRLLQILVNWKN